MLCVSVANPLLVFGSILGVGGGAVQSLSLVQLFEIPWTIVHDPDKNTGVGNRSLLQGIFPTQGLNPGLPYCRQILYQLSHREATSQIMANFSS